MLFTSWSFALFLPIVFALYWFAMGGRLRLQNILLLVASYYFYACWDWRFLFLLIFSTLLDYASGLQISRARTEPGKAFWFWMSVGVNLGFLAVFKYYNFFATSMVEALATLGLQVDAVTLEIVLPVGISFYTFHGLSYLVDVRQERIEPEKNFVDYAVFVSFFPLLVAGPIERATHLLPQIVKPRVFDRTKAVDGLRQILWGLFKKLVIADACAWYVNMMHAHPESYRGSTLLMGAILFTFQIYGDFSGYSDIAIGTARLFGIDLIRNFNFPLFSKSMSEFWRNWHISLSSWIRDYLFSPLALQFRYWGKWGLVSALVLSFTLNGLWHGANWTFIAWGLLHGLVMSYEAMTQKFRKKVGKSLPFHFQNGLSMFFTFAFWTVSLILFRAASIGKAFDFVDGMLSMSLFSMPEYVPVKLFAMLGIFMVVEYIGRKHQYGLQFVGNWKRAELRVTAYYAVILLILFFGMFMENSFIYFQF